MNSDDLFEQHFGDVEGGRATAAAVKEERAKAKAKSNSTSPKTKAKSKMGNTGKVEAAKTKDEVRAKHWTGSELEALLDAALAGPVPSSRFTDKIPGRSTNQCRQAWLKILPLLRKTLRERGGEAA